MTSSMRGPQWRWKIAAKIDTMLSTMRSSSASGRFSIGLKVALRPGWSGSMTTSRSLGVVGDAVEDVEGEVAFGVDEDDGPPRCDVAEDEVGEQGGLAGAGGAEDVQVVAGVGDGQGDGVAADLGAAEDLGVAAAGRAR